MRDVFDYTSPLALLGRIADYCFLRSHMTEFLRKRAAAIKLAAENRRAG